MAGDFTLPRMAEITPTSIADVAIPYDEMTNEQLGALHLETLRYERAVLDAIAEQKNAINAIVVARINDAERAA